MKDKNTRSFYLVLANTLITNIVNSTVWFAIIFYIYLQTKSVLASSILSGMYLLSVTVTGFWFGSIVDNNKKKNVMVASSFISLIIYAVSFIIYHLVDKTQFTKIGSPTLWIFVILVMSGVIAGNLRSISMPTLVTILIPENKRDKANGLVGTVTGISFLVVSVFSGILVGHSGMNLVLILAIVLTIVAIIHIWTIDINETKIVSTDESENPAKSGIDIKGTFEIVKNVDGLMPLIFFTAINNFLGGVFMSLMDPYGLSLVSVQTWGLLWGFISTAFIVGGAIIAKKGVGKKPLRSLFIANIIIWIVSSLFTIQPSIILICVGMYIYLCVVPFIEAAEHTIIQKVVAPERQGRIFGFAQSIEMAASPLTAFLIGPVTELVFIPFMTDGKGAELIGDWYGTGPARGIALVFSITGVTGLVVTLISMRLKFYKDLSRIYELNKNHKTE